MQNNVQVHYVMCLLWSGIFVMMMMIIINEKVSNVSFRIITTLMFIHLTASDIKCIRSLLMFNHPRMVSRDILRNDNL